MSRKAAVKRRQVKLVMIDLNIDGKGIYEINTGVHDHMLEQLSKHGFFDLRIIANGDKRLISTIQSRT